MAREQVEFIQSQVISWQSSKFQQQVNYKTLSADKDSGAITGLFQYAQGWVNSVPYHLNCDEEFFVLSGSITINNCRYGEGYYGFFPAGYRRISEITEQETVILRFIDGSPHPHFCENKTPAPGLSKDAITGINTFDMHWDKGVHDKKLLHLDFGRKILRIDPVTKAKTFLYMVSPQTYPDFSKGPREHHPTVEEAFVLHGTLAGDRGIMRTGAYFWRPPGIPHGPYGSRTGSVMLIRFVGGEHINHWSEQQYPFSFDPPYNPVLPEHLIAAGKKEWRPEPF